MNYYLRTVSTVSSQPKKLFGLRYGWTKPIIDIISFHIVNDKGQEFYGLSGDFNLDWAWGRRGSGQIFHNIYIRYIKESERGHILFNKGTIRGILRNHGRSLVQLRQVILEFTLRELVPDYARDNSYTQDLQSIRLKTRPSFFSYNSSISWVSILQLFGGQGELPRSYPKYCINLRQELDRVSRQLYDMHISKNGDRSGDSWEDISMNIRRMVPCMGQKDAEWARGLHKILLNV